MSEVNRQAVIGFYLQGDSYEELAQLLGVPVSTVKGRLFQGRKLLKTLLRPLADTLLQLDSKQRKDLPEFLTVRCVRTPPVAVLSPSLISEHGLEASSMQVELPRTREAQREPALEKSGW